ncbi:MAG: AAA family ATPase [Candidatus Odinarchaeum yellowstonii]|uniref:ORC1-type DNA replication protein n=1 Tax=Odinarchaeota yellowstonii (strain LCB_4) TaxID=1841599 RepID=A0AAF0D379_ODILC|nr:MAG: AAA family ATPase [Candidatus Odinarchaeum yellowstonii]
MEEDWSLEKYISRKSVFKKNAESTLSPSYVPKKLPGREAELQRLTLDFQSLTLDEKGYSVNVAVIGPPGSGKTALVRNFGESLAEYGKSRNRNIIFEYLDCFAARTKSSVLSNILAKFNITSRGFSDEELLSILLKRLNSEEAHLVIGLDEAYILGGEAILSIIRSNDVYSSGLARISTIIISRLNEWRMLLNTTLSGRITDQIMLAGYSKETLLEIIRYRAELAFKPGVISEGVLEMIADIAAKTENARHAIELLFRAGKIADHLSEDVITPEMIRKAKDEVFPEFRADIFHDLKKHELISALAVAKRLKHKGVISTTIDEAYEYYKTTCEEYKIEPRSKSAFREFIKFLTDLGVISSVVINLGSGRRGRRSVLRLYDLPAEVLEERCRKILENKPA